MVTRWFRALWVGKVEVSDEHILVFDNLRLAKVRTIRRLPDGIGSGQRWDEDRIFDCEALPWGANEKTMQDTSRTTRRRPCSLHSGCSGTQDCYCALDNSRKIPALR